MKVPRPAASHNPGRPIQLYLSYYPLMARSSKKARRLTVGSEVFLWSLGHEHRAEQGQFLDCHEVLTIHRDGARGRLRIFFQEGPGRVVPRWTCTLWNRWHHRRRLAEPERARHCQSSASRSQDERVAAG
jgi:hypothetical protein